MLVDRAEAEDAVQHTFLEAWRCLPRFEGRSQFTTWLTRIAIFTCLGTKRRLARLTYDDDTEKTAGTDKAQWGSAAIAPDELVATRARSQAVQEILKKVGLKKRAVLVMADFEGMTAPEIGAVLGIPDATVRTRLFHARKEVAAQVRLHPAFADFFAAQEKRKPATLAPGMQQAAAAPAL